MRVPCGPSPWGAPPWLVAAALAVGLTAPLAPALAGPPESVEQPVAVAEASQMSEARIAALVDQLAADSFQAREAAMAELLAVGPAALPALRKTDVTSDPELRQRVEVIVGRLANEDFEARIAAFLANEPDASLPGWEYAAAKLGDRPVMRELFVEITRKHPEFAAGLEGAPRERAAALARLTTDVLVMTLDFSDQPTIADAVAILLAATDTEIPSTESTDAVLLRLLRGSDVPVALTDPKIDDVFRKLVGQWLVRVGKGRRLEALALATQWEIPEVVQLAKTTLGDTDDVETLQWSLIALARFGQPADAALIKPLLDDRRAAANGYVSRDPAGRLLEVQLRDVAMAAIALIHDRDLRDMGFPVAQTHPIAAFDPDSLGFPEGEAGEEARQRVRDEIEDLLDPTAENAPTEPAPPSD